MKTGILTILFVLAFSWPALAQQHKQITSKEAAKMLNTNRSIVVLDVRTPDEFNQGHIKGAINIDIRQSDAFNKIGKLNPNAAYMVHCRTQNRSTVAVDYMLSKGFKNIYLMTDGYNGWSLNNLPTTK